MFAPPEKAKRATDPKGQASQDGAREKAPLPNRLWQSIAFGAPAIQAKLAVSRPDDPYEREADRIADHVMRADSTSADGGFSFLSVANFSAQRKCGPCEEEEEKLQRKASSDDQDLEPVETPAIGELTSSRGEALEPPVREFFEPRLGRDLGDVRIHRSAQADAASRSVNALAFTIGQHIAFRGDAYSPQTDSGRRLLAHELVHFVQQGSADVNTAHARPAAESLRTSAVTSPLIQRAAPPPTTAAGTDFDIVGKSRNTASDLKRIHFDKDGAVVDSEEEKKLAPFMAIAVKLFGHQSEDEAAGTDDKRAKAVEKALVDGGHDAATITRVNKGVESQIQYREARIVEIVEVGAAPTKTSCPASPTLADMTVACKTVGRSAPFRAGLAAARKAIAKSRELLKTDAAKGTPSAATLDVVKRKFAKASNSDKVREKLNEIDGFLKNIPAKTECHNECDSDCGTSAYWDPGRKKMVLCPPFDGLGPEQQAGTIMHEATHGVPTIKSEDFGYASDRIIDFLDEAHAFKNTDSYTTLVRELTGISNFADQVPADTFSGFGTRTMGGVSVNEQDVVKKAEALAEKWCIWAYQDLEFIYGGIRDAIAGSTTLAGPSLKEVMKSLHTHFGLTEETLKPVMSDQIAAAALRDKFVRFGITTFNKPLTVTAASPGASGFGWIWDLLFGTSTAWGASTTPTPGGPWIVPPNLEIGDDFWAAADDNERAKLLIEGLAIATTDTTGAKVSAYAKFAFERSLLPDRL